MNENKPSLLKRLIHKWNEQRGMTAMANVMSGRKCKWYDRPLDWVAPFVLGVLVTFTVCWEGLRYFGLPLIVVCMFFTLHRMNNQLDRIEAQLAQPVIRKVITTIPISEYIEHLETEHPETE